MSVRAALIAVFVSILLVGVGVASDDAAISWKVLKGKHFVVHYRGAMSFALKTLG